MPCSISQKRLHAVGHFLVSSCIFEFGTVVKWTFDGVDVAMVTGSRILLSMRCECVAVTYSAFDYLYLFFSCEGYSNRKNLFQR